MRAVLLASLLLLVTAPAAAQLTNLPALSAPVNDLAGVIDADSARDLDARIRALKNATGDVVIVTTVPTIAPYGSVEEYTVKLFEKAGIGSKKLDNGLLILVAVKEHGLRVEVGYGLEGIITDGFAGETIRQLIVPEFKAGRYGPGLLAGTTHLIDRIAAGRKDPASLPPPTPPTSKGTLVLGFVVIFLIGGAVLALILYAVSRIAKATGGARSTASSSWTSSSRDDDDDRSSSSSSSSSSSGSDFGGFDGGSSGGGGASGSW